MFTQSRSRKITKAVQDSLTIIKPLNKFITDTHNLIYFIVVYTYNIITYFEVKNT